MSTYSNIYTGQGFADGNRARMVAEDAPPAALYHGVTIKADSTNDVVIYVGTNTVTVGTGFELAAGKKVFLPLDEIHNLYVIATTSGNSTQVLTINDLAPEGKFALAFEGQTTADIADDASAATVQSALEALSTIGAGNVTVAGSAGGPYTVTFVVDLAGIDVEEITGAAVTERQTVTVSSGASPDTMFLTYDGETTAELDYDASAAEVEAALEALTGIGEGNVSVSLTSESVWVVSFVEDLADTDVAAMTGVCGSNEVQTITLSDTIAGDTFQLTYDGQTTSDIAYDATAAAVDSALEALANIDAGDVSVTGEDGGPFAVEFTANLGYTDVNLLTGVAGTDEVQTVTISDSIAGDTFTLTYDGQTTSGIAYDATGATVDTALEALSNIGAGDVAVTGSAGGPYTVTFGGTLANTDVALITGIGGTNEVQTVTLSSTQAGDTFQLTYDGQTTADIAYDAAAATVESALEALSNITAGDVAVTGSAGGPFTLTFGGNLALVDVDALTGVAGTDEVNTITLSGTIAGDTFQLTYDGQTTSDIAYDAEAATVQTALEALSNLEVDDVVVTGSAGGPFTLTFGGLLANTNVTVTGVGGTDEVQTVTLSTTTVNDLWTLTYDGQTTSELAIDASAATVQAALEALSNITAGDVAVTGSDGGPYTLTFGGLLANTGVAALTGSGGVNEVQTVTLSGSVGADTFTLTYDGQTTTALDDDASDSDVEAALEALSNIDSVAVVGDDGGPWEVEFRGTLAQTAVDLMTGVAGTHEVQTVTLSSTQAGDVFALTYDGQTTSEIAYDAAAATVETALEALSNITAGDVVVSGSAGGPFVLTFAANLGYQDVDALTGIAGTDEVQTVTLSATQAGDVFTLTYDGQTTSEIAYDAEAATVQAALEALSNITAGDVAVTGSAGGPFTLTFDANLGYQDVAALTAAAGTDEVQTVTLSTTTANDLWALTYDGQTTADLAIDASAADVQTALEDLSNVAVGDVVVTGEAGGPYTLTFDALLGYQDVAALTGAGGTNEVQTVTFTGVTGGTFTLTYGGQTTGAIDYDADAATLETALEAISSIDAVEVSGVAGAWVVEFQGLLANTAIDLMTGNNASLTGDPKTIGIVETIAGNETTVGIVETTAGHEATIGVVETTPGHEATLGVVETTAGRTATVASVETIAGNETTVGVVETTPGNEATVGIVETTPGHEATIGIVETTPGNTLTVGVVETTPGNAATIGIVETVTGHEATVSVVETVKGDADASVTVVATDASDGCAYSWIGM